MKSKAKNNRISIKELEEASLASECIIQNASTLHDESREKPNGKAKETSIRDSAASDAKNEKENETLHEKEIDHRSNDDKRNEKSKR